ncbi:MAG TPA: ABC transporter ATP-binding protein, partial [Stellaceae bacterium]|nr:ABC transporter ATP-binding protein [Stellaceae bacterium]
GSGKSTSLRMINRLLPLSDGIIRFGGADVTSLKPEELRRRIGYVIQSVGLFPHWTVARNVATVPELLDWPAARIRARVEQLLVMLRLDPGEFGGKYPHQLSGGQQQRVGIARALAADPEVLLMDEPFGALDPLTRAVMHDEIARIHRDSGKTVLLVTHDMEAALKLASRIAIIDRGQLVQTGTPRELLIHPSDDFVRAFTGRDTQGLALLALEQVAERTRRDGTAAGEPIAANASLREALSRMIERGSDSLPVEDGEGRSVGVIHLADIVRR